MKLLRAFVVLVCFALLGGLAAYSGESTDSDLKTIGVAAFKNGLAFVVKQGQVPLEGGAGRIAPIPAATLGSLWIAPNDSGATLDEVVAFRYKVSTPQNLTVLTDVLLANTGKVVTVYYNNRDYTGEIVGLQKTEHIAESAARSAAPGTRTTPEFLLFKTEGKLFALYLRNITQVVLPNDAVLQTSVEEERKALRFKVKGASGHANVTMGYLERGLGWTPSYLITLTDEKTAKLTMQAVLVNDVEDLKDADVFFVVGVPNFAFSHIPSPMSLQQNLVEFMQEASRRDTANASFGNNNGVVLMSQAESVSVGNDNLATFSTTVDELAGAPEEDLFLYTRSGLTLAHGERGSYNVFSGSVAYEHLYEWEVQDRLRVDGFGNVQQQYQGAPDAGRVNNVWHSLRLNNSTKFPWTSAPAMVISGTKPLSQDALLYTPKGASSNLRLTIATDLRASHEEHEVNRQQNVEHRRGYNFDQVTVEGTLKVKNFKTKEVRLNIGKTLRGSAEAQSDDGTNVKLGEAIQAENPMSRLSWEITLKPGEEKTIAYRYKIWVRV
jgi:hypothetical protein